MASFEAIMKKFLESYEKQTEDVLVKEFMTLKSQSQKYKENNRYPAEAGQLPINKRKNRFKDILPFEYTRVELHPVENVEGSDYINANYILGADGEINYIAAQGPLSNTVSDFWRMLWYHNIEIVVMACREVEMGKNKCERYWPGPGQTMDIGAIQVSTIYEENISNDFVIRDFAAECQGEKQIIRQYHYNAWPDHGKPDSPDPIIRMIEMIESYRKTKDVPVVVHCSAGCGRTGTLIGIDVAKALLLSKDVPPDFSVFKIVEKMRQQRPAMVQAKDQYLFVYMAIAELARRSIGINPTLPPKPMSKPAQPTGKSYMNLDTNTPDAVSSRSPTPSSAHSDSPPFVPRDPTSSTNFATPPSGSTSSSSINGPLYENVNSQPPLPKRNSRNSTPDILSEVPAEKPKMPPVAKPKPRTKPAACGPPVPPEKPHKDDATPMVPSMSLPAVVPKPRPRKPAGRSDSNGSSSTSAAPLASTSAPTVVVTNRPTTPTKFSQALSSHLHTTERSMRPKSPDMSKRPLPPAPGEKTPSSSNSSANVSPLKSPGHRSPRKTSTEVAPVDLTSTYSLMGEAEGDDMLKPGDKSSSSIMDTFKDILGEQLMQSIEKTPASGAPIASRPLPSVPQADRDRTGSVDDAPPAIPQRTDASFELVDPVKTTSVVAPTYDVPGDITGNVDSWSADPPTVQVDDYEEAAPLSISKTTPPPSSLPASLSPSGIASTGSNSSTFSRGGSSHSVTRGGKIGRFFKSKKDNKKKLTDDLTGDHSTSSLSATMPIRLGSDAPRSHPPAPTMDVDEKYKFPGKMGFGIRLERPSGPREEPHHWKSISMPVAIHVA